MNWLRWIGIQLVERLGIPSIMSVVILAIVVGYYLRVVLPLEQQLMAVDSEIVSVSDKRQRASDPKTQIEDFQVFFRERDLEGQLKELNDAGTAAGVAVKRIEYRMLDDQRATLRQYQIVMPVTSSYPNIRKFVSVALAKVPAMSLDHVAFQRKRIGDATVDAELRFTLFLADPV
jgi:hypothetical protein